MKRVSLGAMLIGAVFLIFPHPAGAQAVGDLFRLINPSVVVIRAKGRDVEGSGGLTRFNETGSGVLISADGKIMTAAHVVQSMDVSYRQYRRPPVATYPRSEEFAQ